MYEILMAIVNAVRAMGGGDEDLHRVVTEKGLAKRIAEVIMASAKPAMQPVTQVAATAAKEASIIFKVLVEYIQPCYADLKAAFDWVDPDYSRAKFEPIERCKGVIREAREVVLQYSHLGRDATTEEVLAEMERLGLRPALYEELLVFCRQNPDEQRKFPVVALGSVWVGSDGCRGVAYLDGDGVERDLYLYWGGGRWVGDCRFLAVSK